MYHLGYDYFTDQYASKQTKFCKVCDSICDKTNSYGPRNSIEAMAGHKERYTAFRCPNSKKEWHKNAYFLLSDIEKCHSPSLIKIMKEDLEKLLKENNN